MAVMRKEQRDIDGLGPIGIIREAVKVFWSHAKVFTLIQVALMLDLAILGLVLEYFIYLKYMPTPEPQPDPGPNDHAHLLQGRLVPHSAHCIKTPFCLGGSAGLGLHGATSDIRLFLVLLFVGSGAISILFQIALSLSIAATLYSVGLHYAGQAVSFVDVLRFSIRKLWLRLALTNVYIFLIYWAIEFVQVGFSLFLPNQYSSPVVVLLISILTMVAIVYLQIIFTVAAGVSVLDEYYGWAALRKSFKLVKGKMTVAFFVFVLFLLAAFPSMFIQNALLSQMDKGDSSPMIVALMVLAGAFYLVWTTCVWQFQALCVGVQYVSFKAYHGESLADSLYENRTTKRGFEPMAGDGSDEALLGGQTGENTV